MSTFRYRLAGVSASELDRLIEAGSGATTDLLARPPWTEVTLVDDQREPDLDEFMAELGYVPDVTGPVIVVTADHVMGTESIVLVDASAGPVDVTLPQMSDRFGDELVVMKTDSSSNTVTVLPTGGDTIEGQPLQIFTMQGQAFRIFGDDAGTNWHMGASRRAEDIVFDNTGTSIPGTTVQDAISQVVTQDLTAIETFVAGENLTVGDVLVLNAAGQVIRADSSISGGNWRVLGVSRQTVLSGANVEVFTKFGSSPAARFSAPPLAAQNGQIVFLASASGQATLTPPTTSGNSVFSIGILQGANGVTVTPTVLFQPHLFALRF